MQDINVWVMLVEIVLLYNNLSTTSMCRFNYNRIQETKRREPSSGELHPRGRGVALHRRPYCRDLQKIWKREL